MPKTIAVIDGNSLMHRAYHAIQTPMTSPDGTPTNAVFGFLQMFCKFVEETSPDAVICAFDAGKAEHRIEELPQYKAQRPHMDEELRVQFPVIEELLESMEVPVVKVLGWEGDDILGTVAARDEKLGYKTLLVTGDKDACQLATELTSIVTTKKGISDVVVYGPDEVFEKYGVTPSQFIDYLGLMGDSSDNIPGVPGIGPKTATKLLETYGNIEGIYQHIGDLKGKQRQNLEENEDMAYLSRQIATIVTDLDFPLDLEACEFPAFSTGDVEAAFRKYALSSPLTRVLRLAGSTPFSPKVSLEFAPILEGNLAKEKLAELLSGDAELGLAIQSGAEQTIFGPAIELAISHDEGTLLFEGVQAMDALKDVVVSSAFATLSLDHALKSLYPDDTEMQARISEDELYANRGFDISLAAYDLSSTVSSYTYEALAQRYLGGELDHVETEKEKLAQSACAARALSKVLKDELEKSDLQRTYFDIDLPLVPVLLMMERTGVELDDVRLAELGESASEELTGLAERIYELAGEQFNIDSPKQLSHVLFEVMGLAPIKKNSRGYSTDASVMKELAKTEEIAGLVLKYRELAKIKGTYIDSLPKMLGQDKRLHTEFHETVTATGRLSSSNPNLQNIPVRTSFGRQIRECFVPFEGDAYFMSADYSQIELRLLASLSGDEHLIDAFLSGADFHAQTAARIFDMDIEEVDPSLRSRAKAVNFGIVYGQQAYGLSQSLDIDFSEAKEMIDRYFDAYPRVREYLAEVVDKARESGYAETLFGRRRYIPELRMGNRQQQGVGERTAMNHPMQGTAADIIKLAMVRIADIMRDRGMRSSMILQVHDELDFSVAQDEVEELSKLVRQTMESVVSLAVPLTVDVSWAENWAKAH